MYIDQNPNNPIYQTSFHTLRNYILLNLGNPIVRAEVTDSMLNTAILDAVQRFYHISGQNDFGLVKVSVGGSNEVSIPENINKKMIVDIIFPTDSFAAYTKNLALGDLVGSVPLGNNAVSGGDFVEKATTDFDLTLYQMYLKNLEDIKSVLNLEKMYDIINDKIILYPPTSEIHQIGILYTKLDDFDKLDQEPWIKDYSLARTKMILGTVRRKFSGMQAATGTVQTDGEALIGEAKEEMNRLNEELDLMRPPLPFMTTS